MNNARSNYRLSRCDTKALDLSGVIAKALRRLPESMADDRARRSLGTVARLLPHSFISGPLGLEIRLAGPTAIDLFAVAVPCDTTFDALIEALREPRCVSGWSDRQRAMDLAEVLDRWRRKEGTLPKVARYLLVEVDAPADPDGPVAIPGIFLAPRNPRDIPTPGQPPNAFHRFVDVTTMAAAELSSVWPDPRTAEMLGSVVQAVAAASSDGDIFAIGSMVSRTDGHSLRIAIRRLDPNGIHAVLRAADRPRQADLIADCARTAPAAKQAIAFEIGEGAESRVGLELSPNLDWKQASLQGWPSLLDDIVRRGLAIPERAAAASALVDPDGDPLWGLAHVKVAADEAGMLPVAKLYVGIMHGRRMIR